MTREQGEDAAVTLPEMPLSEHVVNDYQTLKLSLKAHPMQFLRTLCNERKVTDNAQLKSVRNGALVTVAGVVLVRQRPGSAKGVVFLTLEDEFAVCQRRDLAAGAGDAPRHRHGLAVDADQGPGAANRRHHPCGGNPIEDRTPWLALLTEDGALLKNPLARADEVAKPDPERFEAPPPGIQGM